MRRIGTRELGSVTRTFAQVRKRQASALHMRHMLLIFSREGKTPMPLYDCGDSECRECQMAFGPNREKAIRNFEAREAAYAILSNALPAERGAMNAAYVAEAAK